MLPSRMFPSPSEPLVLASQSPIRRTLLAQAGLAFTVEAARVDERALEAPLLAAGVTAEAIALALADAKAREVSARKPGLCIGADQVLGLEDSRLTKVTSLGEAHQQLKRLQGRRHALHSALAISRGETLLWRHVSTAYLTMRPLDDAAIEAYLQRAGDVVLGSVGCYQLEALGIHLFEAIEGDTFTILGLPLLPLLEWLRAPAADTRPMDAPETKNGKEIKR